ncbi:hypothetical protein D1AOALGA4SA_560 [Olavius algarvensis Delta 1 endosymbiont]|nr:hypothetical protein D1AOALGA4SA_560 [Olavius algarvensis Delta 1 endosymbiont]
MIRFHHRTPNAANLTPYTLYHFFTASSIQYPASSIQHPVSSIEHPVSNIQYPVSSIEHQASSIEHPVSSIQYRASSIQHPASSIQHRVSSIQHPAFMRFCRFFCSLCGRSRYFRRTGSVTAGRYRWVPPICGHNCRSETCAPCPSADNYRLRH